MDIAHILSQVKSPFTDEELEKLIKKYIECNCNMREFYKKINNINVEEKENFHLSNLYLRLFRDEKCVDSNSSWYLIASSEEALSIPGKNEDRVPIYRIYINAKGEDKAKIVEEYIQNCENAEQDYKLKCSVRDGRNDEIIILSYGKDLVKNIELIERITEGRSLEEPAKLSGRYKDKIGIAEEYIQEIGYSYTQTRLGIIPIAMQQYIFDNKSQLDKYLDEKHKQLVEYCYRREVRRNKNNIRRMHTSVCGDIPESIQSYMAEHSETAIPEIIENYRLTCENFGISRNGVFSKITEEMLEKQKQTPLQQRETELSSLEAEAREYDEAEVLKDKLEQKEGQNLGE